MVVDDSESQRARLRQDLESGGYQVVEGQNGADGLEKLAANPDLSLVICDVNMPEMDGLTFCSKIQESGKHPGLPIFMLTTEASPELRQRAKNLGVRAWIIKPHVAAKLLEAASKVIKK